MKQRIFISSVQKEFAKERQALKAYILGDALLSRFLMCFCLKTSRRETVAPMPFMSRKFATATSIWHCLGDQYGWEDRTDFPRHIVNSTKRPGWANRDLFW